MFSIVAGGIPEVRVSDLSLLSVPTAPELAQIPGRVYVPGLAMHPSGALLYQPFLTGFPGSTGVKGAWTSSIPTPAHFVSASSFCSNF